MKSILKRLLTGILKLLVLAMISVSIPVSILLTLEYVSPKLGLFPLFTVSILSFLWICLLLIPFVLARRVRISNRSLNQPQVATAKRKTFWKPVFQAIWNYVTTVWNYFKQIVEKIKFPTIPDIQPAEAINSDNQTVKTTIIESTSGILLIINRKPAAQSKASAASFSAK